MGHEEISKRLNAYADGEVSPGERVLIEAHLAQCGICTELLNNIRHISALVRGTGFGRVNAEFVRRLHKSVDELNRRGVERFAWGLVAAAACLALVASVQFYWNPRQTVQPAVAVSAPAAWEGAAVEMNNNSDDTATTAVASNSNNSEFALAQWMVADLSSDRAQETSGHE